MVLFVVDTLTSDSYEELNECLTYYKEWDDVRTKQVEIIYKLDKYHVTNVNSAGTITSNFNLVHIYSDENTVSKETTIYQAEYDTQSNMYLQEFSECSIRFVKTFTKHSKGIPGLVYYFDLIHEWTGSCYSLVETKCLRDNPLRFFRIRAVVNALDMVNTATNNRLNRQYIMQSLKIKQLFYRQYLSVS
jgi:hypothetical protein